MLSEDFENGEDFFSRFGKFDHRDRGAERGGENETTGVAAEEEGRRSGAERRGKSVGEGDGESLLTVGTEFALFLSRVEEQR